MGCLIPASKAWRPRPILIIGLVLLAGFLPAAVPDSLQTIRGYFCVVWSDPEIAEYEDRLPQFFIHPAGEEAIPVAIDWTGPVSFEEWLDFNGQEVILSGRWQSRWKTGESAGEMFQAFHGYSPAARQRLPRTTATSRKWVTIACKFSGIATEPKTVAFFQNQYGTTYPQLNHYWQEASDGAINLTGSTAYGWFQLDHDRTYYLNPNGSLNHTLLFNEATAKADPAVNFSGFEGINMFFNGNLDGYAWGGTRYATLDGVSKVWSVTWEPPWGYESLAPLAHEMGHGFGLPHSSGKYGQVYDNQWDVMSYSWLCNPSDPTYGCTPQHINAYHKNRLNWIPAGRKTEVPPDQEQTITLERLAQPSTANVRLVTVPIQGSNRLYTVEARKKNGYDVQLPGQAVIIHEVDPSRGIPSQVIDIDLNGNTGDAGAQWLPGETFIDAAAGIEIEVTAATATGWTVSIHNATEPDGDLNANGASNLDDLIIMVCLMTGDLLPGQLPCIGAQRGDFDGSGEVDAADCLVLAVWLAGDPE